MSSAVRLKGLGEFSVWGNGAESPGRKRIWSTVTSKYGFCMISFYNEYMGNYVAPKSVWNIDGVRVMVEGADREYHEAGRET